MDALLVVAVISLGVVVVSGLVLALGRKPRTPVPVDVEGWHRRLRVLRDTAQPDAEEATDEDIVIDPSDRNVRVLPAAEDDGGGDPGQATPPDPVDVAGIAGAAEEIEPTGESEATGKSGESGAAGETGTTDEDDAAGR